MRRSLKDLKPGQSGKIVGIKGKGPTKRRLMDMGMTGGTIILVEGVAPLGDPIEVKIKDYRLTLRKSDAENIIVE